MVDSIHTQNTSSTNGFSSMDLNPEYLAMVYDEAAAKYPEATVVDARAALCGL